MEQSFQFPRQKIATKSLAHRVECLCCGYLRNNLRDIRVEDIGIIVADYAMSSQFTFLHNKTVTSIKLIDHDNDEKDTDNSNNIDLVNDYNLSWRVEFKDQSAEGLDLAQIYSQSTTVVFTPFVSDLLIPNLIKRKQQRLEQAAKKAKEDKKDKDDDNNDNNDINDDNDENDDNDDTQDTNKTKRQIDGNVIELEPLTMKFNFQLTDWDTDASTNNMLPKCGYRFHIGLISIPKIEWETYDIQRKKDKSIINKNQKQFESINKSISNNFESIEFVSDEIADLDIWDQDKSIVKRLSQTHYIHFGAFQNTFSRLPGKTHWYTCSLNRRVRLNPMRSEYDENFHFKIGDSVQLCIEYDYDYEYTYLEEMDRKNKNKNDLNYSNVKLVVYFEKNGRRLGSRGDASIKLEDGNFVLDLNKNHYLIAMSSFFALKQENKGVVMNISRC